MGWVLTNGTSFWIWQAENYSAPFEVLYCLPASKLVVLIKSPAGPSGFKPLCGFLLTEDQRSGETCEAGSDSRAEEVEPAMSTQRCCPGLSLWFQTVSCGKSSVFTGVKVLILQCGNTLSGHGHSKVWLPVGSDF